MSTITAYLVKDLREKTGAGMMDCKAALAETGGDMEAAVDWLRKKGLSKAAKKAGRVAAEGLVGVAVSDRAGAVVEVNSETDFVARNELFQETVRTISKLALATPGDTAALAALPYPGGTGTVSDHLSTLVATIGENMTLRRSQRVEVKAGAVISYVHNAAGPDLGRLGVIVALSSEGKRDVLVEAGRKIAMHIAAAAPVALDESGVDPALVARERSIFEEQAKASGKPANVIDKMVEGRIRKFYEEVVLLKQAFVMDPATTVEKYVASLAKDAGAPVTIAAFERYLLGDGIEKDEKDFAAEVAAAVKG